MRGSVMQLSFTLRAVCQQLELTKTIAKFLKQDLNIISHVIPSAMFSKTNLFIQVKSQGPERFLFVLNKFGVEK